MNREALEKRFLANFEEFTEIGASVSVWQDGEEIASFHHGHRDREKEQAWTADTLCPVWSVTKGPAAATTLLALHRAGVAFHSPVASVWPELRAAADGKLTFAHLLAHRAGLAALDSENRGDILHHASSVAALERQEPNWIPGRSHGYHPRTYGFLLDEIVRRVSGGTPLGRYWKSEIATPAGIDFHIGGLGTAEMARLASVVPPRIQRPNPEELPFYRAIADPDSLAARAFASPGGMRALNDVNKPEVLQAGLASLGGVGTASAIARFYQLLALGGEIDGVRLLPRSVVEAARSLQCSGEDETFRIQTAFSCGFMKDPLGPDGRKIRQLFGPSDRAFGQPGAGGCHAFADPENRISFAYVINQMETGVLPNRKGMGLVEVVYEFV